MADAELTPEAPQVVPEEIGGWLFLALIGLVLGPPFFVWRLYRDMSGAMGNRPGAFLGAAIVCLPILGFLVLCLVRFLQRRPSAPWLVIALHGANLAAVVAILLLRLKGSALADRVTLVSPATNQSLALWVQAAASIAWIAYFLTSRRVGATFVVPAPAEPEGGAGIGGWLLLPLALLAAWCVAGLANIAMFFPRWPALIRSAVHHGTLSPLGFVVGTAATGYAVYCLIRFLQRRRETPALMIGFLLVMIAFLTIAGLKGVHHPWAGIGVLIALFGTMMVYFLRSRRVKNTFVR